MSQYRESYPVNSVGFSILISSLHSNLLRLEYSIKFNNMIHIIQEIGKSTTKTNVI